MRLACVVPGWVLALWAGWWATGNMAALCSETCAPFHSVCKCHKSPKFSQTPKCRLVGVHPAIAAGPWWPTAKVVAIWGAGCWSKSPHLWFGMVFSMAARPINNSSNYSITVLIKMIARLHIILLAMTAVHLFGCAERI